MMTPGMNAKLYRSLVLHEDKRNYPYVDSVGKITIGIGYNLSDRGLPDSWINSQYIEDVDYFYKQFNETFSWYKDLNEDRQIALIDMAFMGWKKFLEFHHLIDALSKHDYVRAHDEMLNSKWAEEVKGRAITLANVILTGSYNI